MKYFITALFLALAFTLSGCASDGYNPITGQSTQPGTYVYEVLADGTVRINASTIRGGPDLEVTPEGGVYVTPSREAIVKQLGDLLLR